MVPEAEDMVPEAEDKVPDAEDKVPDGENKVPEAEDKVPNAEDKVADAEDKVPDAEDKVPDAEDNVPDAENKVPDCEGKVPDGEDKVPESEDKVPDGEDKVPDAEDNVPDAEEKVPDAEDKVPDCDDKVPDAKEKVPDAEDKVPGAEDKVPDGEDKVPDDEDKVPDVEDKVPEAENKVPDSEDKVPDGEDKVTDFEDKVPYADDKVPDAEGKVPDADDKVPHSENRVPDGQDKVLDGEDKVPDAENKVSDAGDKFPEAEDKVPGAEDKLPGGEDKVPNAEDKVPDGEDKVPDGEDKDPDAEDKVADAEDKVSDAEDKVPDAEDKVPDAEDKVPHSENRVPDGEDKVLDGEDKVPDAENKVPDAEDKFPEAEDKVPDAENKVAESEKKVANAEEKVPNAEDKVPDGEDKVPDGEDKDPDADDKVPDAEDKVPDGEDKVPDGDDKVPDADDKVPDAEDKVPDAEDKVPDGEDKVSDGEDKVPDGEDNVPDAEDEVPHANDMVPDSEDKVPDGEDKVSDGEDKVPDAKDKGPDAEDKVPEAEDKLPDSEDKVTDCEDKVPDCEDKVPYDDDKVPYADDKVPDSEDKVPDGEDKVSDGEDKVPDGEDKVPDGEDKVPDAEEKVSVAEDKIPDGEDKEKNYAAAVELLERRFGKKVAIERAHVSQLLKVPPVYGEKDVRGLRILHDTVETHYRGLCALKVDENTYSGIVVPTLLEKIPDSVRLTITRGEEYLKWSIKELLQALLTEVELREDYRLTPQVKPPAGNGRRMYNASALQVNLDSGRDKDRCAFCMGKHRHEDCARVKDMRERRNLILVQCKNSSQALIKVINRSKEWLSIILIDLIPVSGDIIFGSFRGAEPYAKNSIGIRVNDEVHETFENEGHEPLPIFGLNASPFLLNATIRHHLNKFVSTDPCFVRKMLEGFYVDDLVSGGNTSEDAFELYNKARSRMESGGFRLRKWKTNDPTLRQKICESEKDVPQQNDTIRFNFEHIARLISGIIRLDKWIKDLVATREIYVDRCLYDANCIWFILVNTIRSALSSQLKLDGVRYWVNEILQLTNKDEWSYVSTHENPADIGIKRQRVFLKRRKRYSSLMRLLKVTAWVRRAVNNFRKLLNKNECVTTNLTAEEINRAEIEWLVRKLGLVEEDGVLRCTGRLGNSDLELDAQKPILLPKEHKFTRSVIEACHQKVHHCGVRSTVGIDFAGPLYAKDASEAFKRCLRKFTARPLTYERINSLPDVVDEREEAIGGGKSRDKKSEGRGVA
ncbi:Hypothetical predicted protein, partial [Paramuricea clavata]